MKYCIQMIHQRNENRFVFAGYKRKDGALVAFGRRHSRQDGCVVFRSIREACRAVDQIDRSVWRPIIRPYPIPYSAWLDFGRT